MNLPPYRFITTSLLALLLAGCAAIRPQECVNADWQGLGHSDGAAGELASRYSEYREICEGAGVTPDRDAYQRGHAEGLQRYCRPCGAYKAGRSGQPYRGVCPAAAEETFLEHYRSGRQIHEAAVRVRQIEGDINQREFELRSWPRSHFERRSIAHNLRWLYRELGRAEAQYAQLIREDSSPCSDADSDAT